MIPDESETFRRLTQCTRDQLETDFPTETGILYRWACIEMRESMRNRRAWEKFLFEEKFKCLLGPGKLNLRYIEKPEFCTRGRDLDFSDSGWTIGEYIDSVKRDMYWVFESQEALRPSYLRTGITAFWCAAALTYSIFQYPFFLAIGIIISVLLTLKVFVDTDIDLDTDYDVYR